MGLADVQRALALLYTDAVTRRRFWADREGIALAWGLAPSDAAQLTALSREEVELFASSLLGKRRNEVVKLLPLTHRVYGARCKSLFGEYTDGYIPAGVGKHRDDAIHFGAWLAAWIQSNDPGHGWIGDIVTYESARLTAMNPKCLWQARIFRLSLTECLRSLTRGNGEIAVLYRPTVAIWWRPSPGGRLRHATWAVPWTRRRAMDYNIEGDPVNKETCLG